LDVIREREDCYELAGPLPSLAVPATLQDSLMARLDRHQSAKPVAQLASTLGREFTYELIKTVSQMDEESLQHQLGQLVQAELLHQRGFPPQATYRFKHALIQQTAYQSVLESQRQHYHGRIAVVLEKKFPGTAKTQPELLAHHFLRSGHPERAVRFLRAAGDKARALYANREAEQSYQEAVRILKLHGRTKLAAETLMKLALVQTAAFEADKAQAAYDEAFQLWKPLRRKRQSKSPGAAAVVLRYAVGEPIALDPGKTYDVDSAFLQAQLFEGLVTVDRDQNVLPAMASRWVASEGGTKYVFYLRENARWSNGAPVRAADFEYAWKRNLSPETDCPAAHLLDCVQNARAFRQGEMKDSDRVGVKALDGHILEVRLEGPTAYLPHLLAHPIAYPLPQGVIQTHQDDWTRPENIVTNGAYRLTARKWGERLALGASEHYNGSFPGNIHQVDCRVFTRHQRAFEAYSAGKLDILDMSAADSGVMPRAETDYNKELLFSPLLSTNYLVFPTDRPPLNDVRVRCALAHAVDRVALTRAVSCAEHCPATGGFVPTGMPAHSARIGLDYDPARGRRLLAEAGYPDGRGFPPVTLLHTHGLSGDGFIPLLRDAWKQNLGVMVDVLILDWDKFQAQLQSGHRHLMLACWVADYPDPDDFLRVVFHSTHGLNEPGWHSDRFNTLVAEASQVTDPLRRIELYREADRILVAEEVAVLPLSYGQIPILVKPWVKRFPLVPSYLRQLKEIVVDRGKSPPSLSQWY
jgi:oligopeptide transport system substrate-binding protein